MSNNPFGADEASSGPQGLWVVDIDGDEIRHLQGRRAEEVGDVEWPGVVQTAATVLSRCPMPSAQTGRATGLALGKIQSGKTLSYTALVALAADNGYRITVVLAGTKNPLLEQISRRLEADLVGTGLPVILFKNPGQQDAMAMEGILHGTEHILIVVLKHRQRIDEVRNLLSSAELRSYPTLVIDDEGDEASLNTQFRRGRQSAVYSSILRLRSALANHSYIAYTATPQANLLIQGIDVLSPDFAVLVSPGQRYCGGAVFFGPNRDRFVRSVPVEEATGGYRGPIPEGMRRAIACFMVGAVVRHRKSENERHSMLIHNSHRRDDHERLQRDVQDLVNHWRDVLGLPDTDPARSDVLPTFREAYDDIASTVANPPSWEDVSQALRNEIWQVEVWMVNSLPLGRDPIETPFRVKNNIVIGGNMLGRGLTISGLAVTYITRRAQNDTQADTLEQRARWFGYKEEYLDVCRIFLADNLRDNYTELLRHEDDFWASLQRLQSQGLSIRDWPRVFSLDMSGQGLRPTRPSVASYRQFEVGGWTRTTQLVLDRAAAANNIQRVTGFFAANPGVIQRYGRLSHRLLTDSPTGLVISDLLSGLQMSGSNWENDYVIHYLGRLLLSGDLMNLDVLLMEDGRPRERSEAAPGRYNIFSGRDPGRDPSDPDFYPGDENFHGGRVQLQVHIIRANVPGQSTPVDTVALALFIPPGNPRLDPNFVVRDELAPAA
jgi:Z1 domain